MGTINNNNEQQQRVSNNGKYKWGQSNKQINNVTTVSNNNTNQM